MTAGSGLLVSVALRPEAHAVLRAACRARRIRGHAIPFWRACAGDTNVWLVRTGVGPHRARLALERALRAMPPPSVVLDAGCAGGLAAQLPAGAVVVPESVVESGGKAWPVDEAWRARLAAAADEAGCRWTGGVLLASPVALCRREEKAAAAALYRAAAVSMESGAVARVCAEREIPFASLRVVLDPAEVALAGNETSLIAPDGRARPGALAAHPLRTVALARAMRRVQAAMAAVLLAAFRPA